MNMSGFSDARILKLDYVDGCTNCNFIKTNHTSEEWIICNT